MLNLSNLLTYLIFLCFVEVSHAVDEPQLVYTFELVRHGARAPMIGSGFANTPKGQLTAMGMRQRYLLGKYNRVMKVFGQYSNQADQINMSSTEFYRTIQSGYSEMLGLLGSNHSRFEFTKTKSKEMHKPNHIPFKVRRK